MDRDTTVEGVFKLPDTDWWPPRLGRYHLVRRIGSGGMAEVFEAIDERREQRVALKLLKPSAETRIPSARRRFMREGRLLEAMRHDNVVKVHEVGIADDTPYISMELCCRSLAERLRLLGPLSPVESVRILTGVLSALTRAHTLGVVHRDIKPANILLAEDGAPKLADFGVALPPNGNSTPTGGVLGTPAFMPPEQKAGRPVDHRADIYACGVTLYTLVTGCAPDLDDAYQRAGIESAVPQPLIAPILTATMYAPERRYVSCYAMMEALRMLGPLPRVAGSTSTPIFKSSTVTWAPETTDADAHSEEGSLEGPPPRTVPRYPASSWHAEVELPLLVTLVLASMIAGALLVQTLQHL